MLKILRSYNFNFLLWNWSIEKFNQAVKIPNSTLGFNYKKDITCIYIGKWLLTLKK